MTRSPDSDVLEARIADVLARQAAALDEPTAALALPTVGDDQATRPRHRAWLVAAAAGIAVLAMIGLVATRSSNTTDLDPAAGNAPFSFHTARVHLDAEGFVVAAPGGDFVPPADTEVSSDPGEWARYTTLELVWFESGIEMRTNLYIESDGSDWWVSEARTYDGGADPEWRTLAGEFARTALGDAFEGDLEIGDLRLTGLRLEAFPLVAGCAVGRPGLALVPLYDVIPGTGGWSASLVDAATCAPVAIDDYGRSYRVVDPSIATVVDGDMSGLLPLGMLRFELEAHAIGTTSVVIEVTDDSGAVAAALEMPVVIEDLPLSADVPE